jgi:protoporphyrin/coproporphyrin ferrochelatase
VVLPLYPQHASSSTGSTLERVYSLAAAMPAVPAVSAVPAFYDDPAFLSALQAIIAPSHAALFPTAMGDADHVLFSFHGLPERQVRATDPSGAHCLASPTCCDAPSPHNRDCYRFQSFATARALARGLRLPADRWSVSFQSRLGRTPWIQPFTDEHLPALYGRGVRRLLVATPSFVADCLETVEEIGIRARQQWADLGGGDFGLAPCLNSDPSWADAVADLARRAVGHR